MLHVFISALIERTSAVYLNELAPCRCDNGELQAAVGVRLGEPTSTMNEGKIKNATHAGMKGQTSETNARDYNLI